LKMQN